MTTFTFKLQATVIMVKDEDSSMIPLSDCEVEDYEVEGTPPQWVQDELQENILHWSYPGGLIDMLQGEGFCEGRFKVFCTIILEYWTDYWGEHDLDIEYEGLLVGELD